MYFLFSKCKKYILYININNTRTHPLVSRHFLPVNTYVFDFYVPILQLVLCRLLNPKIICLRQFSFYIMHSMHKIHKIMLRYFRLLFLNPNIRKNSSFDWLQMYNIDYYQKQPTSLHFPYNHIRSQSNFLVFNRYWKSQRIFRYHKQFLLVFSIQ